MPQKDHENKPELEGKMVNFQLPEFETDEEFQKFARKNPIALLCNNISVLCFKIDELIKIFKSLPIVRLMPPPGAIPPQNIPIIGRKN